MKLQKANTCYGFRVSRTLCTLTGRILLLLLVQGTCSPLLADFIRGDANGDERINVGDAVTQLFAVFRAGFALDCEDAADTNDDGRLDISDALATLRFLFRGAEIPYPGAMVSGPDPTCDTLFCSASGVSTPAILLSEIQYNPLEVFLQNLEFIELFNRSDIEIDVGGYRLTEGVLYTIPEGTVIPPRGFLLLLKDPDTRALRASPAPKLGPYEGNLADGGERLTLKDGDCLVETVRYDDRPPWPIAADGYRPSLERIDYLAPASDYHSWRASLVRAGPSRGGTPGKENSSFGIPTHPTIYSASFEPEHPGSKDAVRVGVTLDVPRRGFRPFAEIGRVTVRWEVATAVLTAAESIEMARAESGEGWVRFTATLPPQPSQSLVRCNLEVELAGGSLLTLPHPGNQVPFLNYFVFDGEVKAKLPIFWVFPPHTTGIVPRELREFKISAIVVQEVGPEEHPLIFEAAEVRRRQNANTRDNGLNLKFLKGIEWRGNRTLNTIPERGGQGLNSAHTEQLAFQICNDNGALAPSSEWIRLFDLGRDEPSQVHTQSIVIQQPNKRFFWLNGINPDGDLYKLAGFGVAKRTNVATGNDSLSELFRALNAGEVRRVYDLENLRRYSAMRVLIGDLDGFGLNNLFAYYDSGGTGLWKLVPWDMDGVFRCPDMSPHYPVDGKGSCVEREPIMVAFYHREPDLHESYLQFLRETIAPGGGFSREAIGEKILALESLLLDDLELQESFMGVTRTARRQQITSAYGGIRSFVDQRITFLQSVLE